jgi:hypothetical protein
MNLVVSDEGEHFGSKAASTVRRTMVSGLKEVPFPPYPEPSPNNRTGRKGVSHEPVETVPCKNEESRHRYWYSPKKI